MVNVKRNLIEENALLRKTLEDIIIIKQKKDDTVLKMCEEEWQYLKRRVSKNTHKKYSVIKNIPCKNVDNVWAILKNLTDISNPTTTYREVVSALIVKYKLKVKIDAFNGGRNRQKFLFPMYYYPLKILHKLGYIYYSGSSIIVRLKFSRIKKVRI